MKTRITLFAFLLICVTGLNAQTGLFGGSGVPFKPQSPLFGKDIVINDQPIQNQRTMAICSAFNGWLFSVYSYYNYNTNFPSFTIMKSNDNGITWTILTDSYWQVPNYECKSIDITVIGDSVTNLKVIIAGVVKYPSFDGYGEGSIVKFNAETGDFEEILFINYETYDIAISSDYNWPTNSSYSSSFGFIYSKYGDDIRDSVIFATSSNGGISF